MKQVDGIWLPDDDEHFAEHLAKGPKYEGAGSYQMKKIEAALRVADRRGLAIDVGAHVGLWSRVLARNFQYVMAFEPVPHLARCFVKNLAGRQNVTLLENAVGSESGKLLIKYVAGNSGNSRVCCPGDDLMQLHINARAVTLDELRFESVDLIKIDVEGWELRVVEGARHLITRCRPVIVVEQKPGNAERYGVEQRAAVDLLQSWGASILWEKAGDVCLGW